MARVALNAAIALELSIQRLVDIGAAPMPPVPADTLTAVIKTFERPRELRRLVRSIKRLHPELPILIVDDSEQPEPLAGVNTLAMPANSGISAGRNAALDHVTTPLFFLLDDDFVFTRWTRLNRVVTTMLHHEEIDIVGGRVVDLPDFITHDYSLKRLPYASGRPIREPGTLVAELPVMAKVPNFFVGRTSTVRSLGWDPELKVLEHQDFFARAWGRLVTTYDHRLTILHARNPFDWASPTRTENATAARARLAWKYSPLNKASDPDPTDGPPRVQTEATRIFHSSAAAFADIDADIDVLLPKLAEWRPGDEFIGHLAEFDDTGFMRLLVRSQEHGVLGSLGLAVDPRRLSSAQLALLDERMMTLMLQNLRIERVALKVIALMGRRQIPLRVLKGVALAHVLYDQPELRTFRDVDLLLPTDSIDEAAHVICEELDGEFRSFEPRPGFEFEFGKAVTVAVDGVEIDLHRRLASAPFGLSTDLDEVFSGYQRFELGGIEVATLDQRGLLVHAMYNASIGDLPPKMASLRDLRVMAEMWPADLANAADVMASWGATACVQKSCELVATTFGLRTEHPVSEQATRDFPTIERFYLWAHRSDGRAYRRAAATIVAVRGVRPRGRYTRAILFPSAAFLRLRGWGRFGFIRNAFAQLVGGLGA